MIVNADDFGLSADVNRAIVAAFERGLVSSTTLMANMPGFEEACGLARERGLLRHVGLHLVLSEGEPLTEPIRRCLRFCDESGRFVAWVGPGRALSLDTEERDAVARELRAQVERCREGGLSLTHLDSHHHAHFELGVAKVVIALAPELRVPAVRVMSNAGAMSLSRRAYTAYFNRVLGRAGLAATRYSGTVEDYLSLARSRAAPARLDDFEIATHPGLGDAGELVDRVSSGAPLAGLLAEVDGLSTAVSYAGVRYA